MNLRKMYDYINYKPTYEENPIYILEDIIKKAKVYLPQNQIYKINKAYEFAKEAHSWVKRLSWEYYISHPLKATEFLMEIKPDIDSIQTCLLHDVIEDTEVTADEIKEIFWEKVAFLCEWLEKVSKIKYKGEDRHIETLKKTFIAMAQDLRVIFIKLADRVHNIQTLHYHPKEKKRIKIAEETMKIFVPIAKKLWLYNYQLYLENWSFKILDEENFTKIFNHLKKNFWADNKYKDKWKKLITNFLKKEWLKNFIVEWRLKSPRRIHQKMTNKYNSTDISSIMDLLAYRIVTDTVASCYIILGIIHKYYTPLIKKIKDYIAIPKFNGYRSIHTTILGIFQFPIEIQIRTKKMDEIAKYWVAAHYEYSEKWETSRAETQQWKRIKKIQNLVQTYKEVDKREEFKDNLNIEVLEKNVFLYTPQWDVIELPQWSSVLDYAFRIHTDIWLKFKNAIINGEIKPINYKPETWDIVEIKITKNKYTANKHRLDFLHAPSSKSQLKRFLNIQQKEDRIKSARKNLNKKLEKFNLPILENTDNKITKLIKKQDLNKRLLKILDKKDTYNQLIKAFYPKEREIYNNKIQNTKQTYIQNKKENISVIVDCDKLINYTLCSECDPKPWDIIIARSGKTWIKIHTVKCKWVKTISPEKLLEAHRKWQEPTKYETQIELKTNNNDQNIIRIMTLFSEFNITISQISIQNKKNNISEISLKINFINPTKLAFLLNNLKKYKNSIKITKKKFI